MSLHLPTQSTINTHRKFFERLLSDFGVRSFDERDIEKLPQPQRGWLQWGLGGFDRAKATFTLLDQLHNSSQKKRHLDIGCGPGYLSATFAKYGSESIGIDINDADVERANVHKLDNPTANLTFLNFDITKNDPRALGLFDIITIDNVIEHVPSVQQLISSLRPLLKPDGIVFIVVPNGFSLQTVRSDPHYNTFALSLIDKITGDAVVQATQSDFSEYEVNDFFSKYEIANYEHAFHKYGFKSTFIDLKPEGDEFRLSLFKELDVGRLREEFNISCLELSSALPEYLAIKVRFISDLYLLELENDHKFAWDSESLNIDFVLKYFVPKYLLATWFFCLELT